MHAGDTVLDTSDWTHHVFESGAKARETQPGLLGDLSGPRSQSLTQACRGPDESRKEAVESIKGADPEES